MMGSIATLAVSLTARTKKFEKGFNRARKITSRFGRDITRHTKTIAGFGFAAGAIATTGITALVKKQFSAIDSTAKLADVIGFTTEQLSGYQYGAKIAGIEQDRFNSSLIRFSKSIADAQDGLTTPLKALDRLGLKFEDLQNLTKNDQFLLISDRFAQLGNQIDRDAVLLNLFGRNGAAMGKFLEEGSSGIVSMLEEAEKFGYTINRVDAAKIEQANDATTRLGALITGAARRLAHQMAPVLTELMNRMIEFSNRGTGLGDNVAKAFNKILTGAAKTADFFELLKSGWYGFEAAVSGTTSILFKFAKLAANAFRPFAQFFPKLENGFMLLDSLSTDFIINTEKSTNKALKAFEKFQSGANLQKAYDFIEEAQKSSSQMIKTINLPGVSVPNINPGTYGDNQFKQGDFSRILNLNSGSGHKKDGATETQGNRIIELLEKIESNNRGTNTGFVTT